MIVSVTVPKKCGCKCMFASAIFINEHIECIISQLNCAYLFHLILFRLPKQSKCIKFQNQIKVLCFQ